MASCTAAEKSAFLSKISADVNNRAITIGTYNVNQYVNQWTVPVYDAVRACMLRGIGIVGIQEYCEFTNYYTTRTGTPGAYKYSGAIAGGNSITKIAGVYDFIATQFNQNLSWGGGKAGNGVASLFGFQQTPVPKQYTDTSGGVCGYVKTVVNTAYKNVSIYTTHFPANGNTYIKPKAEELARVFKEDTNYYKVIVGDLNSWNANGELNSLLNSVADGGCGLKPVFPLVDGQIDNILAPEYMTVLRKGADMIPESQTDAKPSDHKVHYATLQFN
ncbi:endonuclease/exonuclease/phosphatase family protein [Romboutsia sp.]|uniref:endonuclease/exonuclease/phosphatase family protein n=1 Tax=Romboutsia sp. TaxID=1965302 RepID=UPI003F2EAA0B